MACKAQTETTGTYQKQQLNADYNTIYRENLPTLFLGNAYGGAEKTLLVTDINPNVVVFATRKSRFFFVFLPWVSLRLLSAYKSPVRSQSYMPGGMGTSYQQKPS
jgi:hypothetical protein